MASAALGARVPLTGLGFALAGSAWAPVAGLGVGAYHGASGDLGRDTDSLLYVGLGLRGSLSERLAVRVDARNIWSDYTPTHGPASNLLLTLGLDVFPWGADEIPDEASPPVPPPVPPPAPEASTCPDPAPSTRPEPAQLACPEPPPPPPAAAPHPRAVPPPVHVRFPPGGAELPAAARSTLDVLAALLHRDPAARLRIEGHTDDSGEPARNEALSSLRAEAVRAYVLDRGVPAERLTVVAVGSARPVASAATPKARAQNRRVEVHVTGDAPSPGAPAR